MSAPGLFHLRVHYEDTDLAGIVYHANYLKFVERGRSEALRQLGIDQRAMAAEGVFFVVRRMVCDFLAPARFEEALAVHTQAERVRGASVDMVQTVLRGDEALFRAEVVVACLGPAGAPLRLPRHVREKLPRLLPSASR